MRRPRVLLVVPALEHGGAEHQVVQLALGLEDEGFSPEVAVFYHDGPLEAVLARAGVPIHHLRRGTTLGFDTVWDLRRLIREQGYAIVHSYLWPANWRSRLALLFSRRTVTIASFRSVDTWIRASHVLVERLLEKRTDAIVVNASVIRDFYVSRVGLSESRFRVIPNGLDLESIRDLPPRSAARRSLGLPASGPIVLSVGGLRPAKNHEDFLLTAARVRENHPDALFLVAGADTRLHGGRMKKLQALAVELGIGSAVRWLGFQADIRPCLAVADVLVNTSKREGCCNAIIEAMVAGRPVAAYAVGGNPDLVIDGVTGRLAKPGATDELALAVSEYLSRPELAERHGKVAATRAGERFSREAMAAATASLYRGLLEKAARC